MGPSELEIWIKSWRERGATVEVIGNSVLEKPIYAVHIGDDSPSQQLYTAGIHAREHLTADSLALLTDETLLRKDELNGGVWFVPLVNPDGAQLCLNGTAGLPPARAEWLTQVNGGTNFSLWKANADAVDLNCNFPADWGTGVGNVFSPAPSSYVGPYPASEPETRALMDFTKAVRPCLTVSFHSKGRIIYWEFGQTGEQRERDYRLASLTRDLTGYALVDGTLGSAGGYKDYCIQTLHIPSVTVELYNETYRHPLPFSVVEEEYGRLRDMTIRLSAFCEETTG